MATVVAVSGAIRSGKTTLADALAERLGWTRASFGDAVRAIARERGLAADRETLQALGAELVVGDLEGFVRRTLAQAKWGPDRSVVLDGVRHVKALEAVRRVAAAAEVVLVYVSVPDPVRAERLGLSAAGSPEELRRLDVHSTEAQVAGDLRPVADLEVDGTHPVDTSVETIARWIETRADTAT